MKKIIPLLLIICLLLSSCQIKNKNIIIPEESVTEHTPYNAEEIHGIWISCYDHIIASGKTRSEYKLETDKMFYNIKEYGFNTAFVHLRAFSDAFYKSDIYPYSSFIAGVEGADIPFDPFEVILESADKFGISVHGWINPFRISTQNDISVISDKNPAKKIIESGNKNGEICILKNGIYYNPSYIENHKIIIDGVREIISGYDIDGIHIDDYFYPSTDETIDKIQYESYLSEGGKLSISEWRKTNVNAFVSALYSAVKSEKSDIVMSISPSAKFDENENKLFADVNLWLSQKGYADIIIPQIYFGFEHETLDFENLLSQWGSLERNESVSLLCGLAAYKCGTADDYAGLGENEWIKNSDILSRQLNSIRKNSRYNGFVVFSYNDLIRENSKTELTLFKEALKTGNLQ